MAASITPSPSKSPGIGMSELIPQFTFVNPPADFLNHQLPVDGR